MEEIRKKIDRRVIKTKRAIRRAFLETLQGKELDKITMKEIADRADVDRKTVYNYYASPQKIFEELEDEAMQELDRRTKGLRYEPENPLAIFEVLTDMFTSNWEVSTHFMHMEMNSRLIVKIIEHLRVKVRETISRSEEIKEERIELVTEFITAGLFSAYRYWFNAKEKCPLEEFSKGVATLVLEGASVALRK